jgi:hypothetical protein
MFLPLECFFFLCLNKIQPSRTMELYVVMQGLHPWFVGP